MDIMLKTNNSRVINVTSDQHKLSNINFDLLNEKYITRANFKTFNVYGDSKYA